MLIIRGILLFIPIFILLACQKEESPGADILDRNEELSREQFYQVVDRLEFGEIGKLHNQGLEHILHRYSQEGPMYGDELRVWLTYLTDSIVDDSQLGIAPYQDSLSQFIFNTNMNEQVQVLRNNNVHDTLIYQIVVLNDILHRESIDEIVEGLQNFSIYAGSTANNPLVEDGLDIAKASVKFWAYNFTDLHNNDKLNDRERGIGFRSNWGPSGRAWLLSSISTMGQSDVGGGIFRGSVETIFTEWSQLIGRSATMSELVVLRSNLTRMALTGALYGSALAGIVKAFDGSCPDDPNAPPNYSGGWRTGGGGYFGGGGGGGGSEPDVSCGCDYEMVGNSLILDCPCQ